MPTIPRAPLARTIALLAAAAGIATLAWAFGPSPSEVAAAWRGVEPGLLALAIAVNAAAIAVRAEAWRGLVRRATGAGTVRRVDAVSAYAVCLLGNLVVPARAGEVLRVGVLGRRLAGTGARWDAVAGSVVAHRLLDGLPFGLLLILALATSGSALAGDPVALAAAVAPIAVLAVAVVVARGRPGDRLRGRVATVLAGVRSGLAGLGDPRVAVTAAALETAAWIGQLAVVAICLAAFGVGSTSIATAAVVLVAINCAVAVPGLPGGVGLFQVAAAAALAARGVPTATGLAFGLGLQGVEILTTLAVGVPFAMREGLRFGRLRLPRPGLAG